jgi:hypothetical protein
MEKYWIRDFGINVPFVNFPFLCGKYIVDNAIVVSYCVARGIIYELATYIGATERGLDLTSSMLRHLQDVLVVVNHGFNISSD